MAQKLFGLGLGASGIVGTLIVAGILLKALNIAPGMGNIAIGGGVLIGLALGFLGVCAVAKKVIR